MNRTVLIVLPNGKLGGAEKVLKMLAENYSLTEDVIVFFFNKTSISSWGKLKINKSITFKYGKGKIHGFLTLIVFLISSNSFQFIFSSSTMVNGILGILRKLKILKTRQLIARESTSIFLRFKGTNLWKYQLIYFFGYSSIDLLICQSNQMKAQFIKHLPKLSAALNIQVLLNPIEIISEVVNKNNLNIPGEFIVSAGRLIKEKGFINLIEAFKIINQKHPNLNLLILGDGKERANIEKKIKDVGLDHKIILLGHVEDVLSYFKEAKVCVVSSILEGFPNVLLEMMSQNTRVVSTNCAGGISEIEGVIMARTKDSDDLALKITKAIEGEFPNNRSAFDRHLASRSIQCYKEHIESHLYNESI